MNLRKTINIFECKNSKKQVPNSHNFIKKVILTTCSFVHTMLCSISGQSPTDPVISRKSGHLFERSLIEKSILENGLCPLSGQPLSVDDLMSVQSNKAIRPRNVATASIPGLLSTFQNEWDEVMLEVFTLKQHLDSTRKELSQALYQHDAACRVIARLMRERDEARAMLTNGGGAAQTNGNLPPPPPTSSGNSMDVESSNSNESASITMGASWNEHVKLISSKSLELSEERKKRPKKIPETTRASDTLSNMEVKNTFSPHKKSSSSAGITSIAYNISNNIIASGGIDKDIHVTSMEDGNSIAKAANSHKKSVTCLAFHHHNNNDKSFLLSGSSDNTIKLWSIPSSSNSNSKTVPKMTSVASFDHHEGAISALKTHPVDNIAVSFSYDGSFSLLDLESKDVTLHINDDSNNEQFQYLCGAVHPDAIMLGGGTNQGVLKIWDIRQKTVAVNLTDHSKKGLTAVDFSNNGYHVGTGDAEGVYRIWDLRKLKCLNTDTISKDYSSINSIKFDDYGSYVAVGGCGNNGSDVHIYHSKEGKLLANLSDHSEEVTGVLWGPNASFLASCSKDNSVKVWK
jgi:pre-mRNA-processing factor 19